MARRIDQGSMDAVALKRDLDLTINQRLNVNFTDREMGAQDKARKSLVVMDKDISSFARFLSQNFCLEILLFWKEVEQYKTLFSAEERTALFSKIYELYCKEGAHWQVNFKGAHVSEMAKAVKSDGSIDDNVSEEIFDAAQLEVYELMRLDLFPRFNDHLADVAHLSMEAEEIADSMKTVLSGTSPAATRSFTRFAREQFCEESLLFWMEANDFALLFQPLDQLTRATSIYETYMGHTAKFKVNVSDAIVRGVDAAIKTKKVTNAVFVTAQREVSNFLEQDVFPRYQEWAATSGAPAPSAARAPSTAALARQSTLGDRKAMREAFIELLDSPSELAQIREFARARDGTHAEAGTLWNSGLALPISLLTSPAFERLCGQPRRVSTSSSTYASTPSSSPIRIARRRRRASGAATSTPRPIASSTSPTISAGSWRRPSCRNRRGPRTSSKRPSGTFSIS